MTEQGSTTALEWSSQESKERTSTLTRTRQDKGVLESPGKERTIHNWHLTQASVHCDTATSYYKWLEPNYTKLTRHNRLQHISPDQLQTRFTDYGRKSKHCPLVGTTQWTS